MQKTLEITQIYQQELSKIVDEQAGKWNEILN